MRHHNLRASAVCLAWVVIAAGCQQRAIAPEVPTISPAALDGLIARVDDPDKTWAASARLQKLGEPAILALIPHLRRDPFADRDHGNHSATMKVLEKIGEPALPLLAAALTSTLLQSTNPADQGYLHTVIMVMARIDRSRAAPSLIRVARSAVDLQLRVAALYGILGPDAYPLPLSKPHRWESCFAVHYEAFGARDLCPDGPRSTSMATALGPMLPEVSALLKEAAAPDLRLAAAHLLARWGIDDLKRQGESELLALTSNQASEVRNQAVRALGMLRVRSSVDRLKAQAADADEELKRNIADALFRLNDSGYVALVIELMNSRNDDMRRWSIEFARASHNVAFVSSVIDHLQDPGWNGTTTSASAGHQETVIRQTLAVDALEALRRLTFQDLGSGAEPWRRWVETHTSTSWESLLNQFVQSRLIELPRAEPHIMNGWMDQLAEADSAAVLPFVEGLLNHPALHLSSLGPNLFSVGGGPPPVLLLLLELADRGSTSAKQLLYHCLTTKDSSLRDHVPFAVTVFDRTTSLDWLVEQLKDRDPGSAAQAARSLVHLGDRRGIPRLIDDLSATDHSQSYLAFMTLKHYTQEDILFDPDAPLAARRDMTPPWRQWWHDHKSDFTVNVRAAQVDSEVFM